MTVRRGPLKSVYAEHAALHSIDTGLILTLLHSLPVYSHMIRLSACLFLHYQAHGHLFSHCQAHCLSSLSLSGSYSLTIRLTACLLSLAGLLPIYSVTLTQARCLSILTLSGSLPVYAHTIRLTAYLFSPAGLLPIYSLTQPRCQSILLRSLKLAACVMSHQQTHCLPILTLSDSLPSILTPSGSLPMYSHTIRLASIYSHSVRLTLYLFSHSCYSLSVLTPNA